MSDAFTIEVAGEAVEVKMTYGMLNSLCRLSGDADAAVMFNLDADLQAAVVRELLAKRTKTGKILDGFELFTLDVDPGELADLLDWAGGHVLDFFIQAAKKAKALGESREEEMKALQPTSIGGES